MADDDLAEGQVGVGPAQEPEGRAKLQRTPRTASGPDDLATSAGSPGGQNAGGQQSSQRRSQARRAVKRKTRVLVFVLFDLRFGYRSGI